MKFTADTAYAYCETHARHVPLDQTEGQCRERHNCSDAACPLEKELGRPRFGRALELMAASIGNVITRPGG